MSAPGLFRATRPSQSATTQGSVPLDAQAPELYRRARQAVLWTLGIMALLLATHLGEFWPFSINPMFSRAGRPFTRTVVRELEARESYSPHPCSAAQLPGRAFPLVPAGIAQNDVADFVTKTPVWTPDKMNAMHHLFKEQLARRRLLILQARGEITATGDVPVSYRPVLELSAEGPKHVSP